MLKYIGSIVLAAMAFGAQADEFAPRGDNRLVGSWTCSQYADPDTIITSTFNADGTSTMEWMLDTDREYVYPVPLLMHFILENEYRVEEKILTEKTVSIELIEYKEDGVSVLDDAREEVERNLHDMYFGIEDSFLTIRSNIEFAIGNPRTGTTCKRNAETGEEDTK